MKKKEEMHILNEQGVGSLFGISGHNSENVDEQMKKKEKEEDENDK